MEQSQHFEEMQSKYALALSKYNTHLHDDEVRMKVDKLILYAHWLKKMKK